MLIAMMAMAARAPILELPLTCGRSPAATPAPGALWSAPASALAGLQLDQVDTESGAGRASAGKGRNDRIGWLPPSAVPAVRDWLAVRGAGARPALLPVRKGDRIENRALPAHAVRDLCRELAQLAASSRSPPDLRGT